MNEPVLVGGSIVDMGGVARAKYVPAARLDAFHEIGMGASPSWSVFTVDGSIAFTGDLGVVGDLRIRIDPADLRDVADGVAWAPGDLHHQDGVPSAMCARTVLRRAVAEAERAGLSARVGAELECTLLGPDEPGQLLLPEAAGAPAPLPDDAEVCACAGVTAGEVRACASVGECVDRTRATTGCGGCADVVRRLVEDSPTPVPVG